MVSSRSVNEPLATVVLLEITFISYWLPGEDFNHGVVSSLWLVLVPIKHIGAVSQEYSSEKGVDGVHLDNDIEEVEDVAHEVLEGVEVPQVESLTHVLDQLLALLLAVVQRKSAAYVVQTGLNSAYYTVH